MHTRFEFTFLWINKGRWWLPKSGRRLTRIVILQDTLVLQSTTRGIFGILCLVQFEFVMLCIAQAPCISQKWGSLL